MLVILTSHPIQYQAPLWQALAKSGIEFEVWFLTPHAVQPTLDKEFGEAFAWDIDLLAGYRHRFLPISDDWNLDGFMGVRVLGRWDSLFREAGATHLWVEGWRFKPFWDAIIAATRENIKVWLRGETNDISRRTGIRNVARRFGLRYLFNKIDRFLCIGTANRRFYKSFGIADERLLHAPYCVDNARFEAAAALARQRRSMIRAYWKIPESSFCVLFCGKFIEKKRPMDLVEALRGLCSESFYGLFVGSGPLYHEITRSTFPVMNNLSQTHHEGIPSTQSLPRISLSGFLNQREIIDAYVASDCLVLPSDSGETWGLVANEAMACGLPCIVSDQCGCAADLIDTTFVFETGNVNDLKDKLLKMRRDPTSSDVVLQNVGRHSLEKTIESVVRELLSKR